MTKSSLLLFFCGLGLAYLILEVGLDLAALWAFDNVHEAVVLRFVEGIVHFLVGQHIVAFALLGLHLSTGRFPDAFRQYVTLGLIPDCPLNKMIDTITPRNVRGLLA